MKKLLALAFLTVFALSGTALVIHGGGGCRTDVFAHGTAANDYLDRYTVGFGELRQRLAEYPPERVAAITQCSMWKSGIGWCTTTSA